jgi:hypothetical protein
MITIVMPVIPEDRHTEEEVRKALVNLAAQLNLELETIKARLDVLEATP